MGTKKLGLTTVECPPNDAIGCGRQVWSWNCRHVTVCCTKHMFRWWYFEETPSLLSKLGIFSALVTSYLQELKKLLVFA